MCENVAGLLPEPHFLLKAYFFVSDRGSYRNPPINRTLNRMATTDKAYCVYMYVVAPASLSIQ